MNNNEEQSRKINILKEIKEYGISIVVALFLAFIFHSYVLARANVDGPSMQPTLHNNDVIFLEKLSVETNNIKRGEIIVFDSKNENHDYYIKRVVGVAGDQVEIKDGKVYVNGNQIVENYLSEDTITEPITPKTTYKVPEGEVFVLGDNRGNSTDSRMLGCINIKDIKGHAILRAYPFNQIRTF
jgi:signal peptidase I, bacterial type